LIDLTGNDYVSITAIGADAGVDGVAVLHSGLAGLVEWKGGADEPLLKPRVHVNGAEVSLDAARWRRLDRWIPSFSLAAGADVAVSGEICAPGGYPPARGFFIRIAIENRGRSSCSARVDLDVAWHAADLTIATPRPLPGRNALVMAAHDVLVLESDDGRGPCLALAGQRGAATVVQASPAAVRNGEPLRARLSVQLDVAPRRSAEAVFVAGMGRERDGACAAVASLQRSGADHWLRQARLDLSHMLRPAQDPRWAELLNRNLIFNRYFAVGRAIDDDRLHLLRSRMPTRNGAATFREHEALFYTMPALIIADPGIAREAILRVLETFSERSGEFVRYIDGSACDPAAVLDGILLYPWAIDRYMTVTGDDSLGEEPLVRQVLMETDSTVFMRLHPQHLLAATELLPCGDTADYPFATLPNALLHAFAAALTRLPWPDEEVPPRFAGAAAEIAAAVWQHCTTVVEGHTVLTSSASLDGSAAVYDDPALSLALLPLLGFCATDDPVWGSTVEFLRSTRYPLWLDGAVSGLAGRDTPKVARTAALCADLTGPAASDAMQRLSRVRFIAGVAAAGYDPGTGDGVEPFDAATAGLLAWTLMRASEPADAPSKRTGRRRPGAGATPRRNPAAP
jgi:hypothetical protein